MHTVKGGKREGMKRKIRRRGKKENGKVRRDEILKEGNIISSEKDEEMETMKGGMEERMNEY